MSQEDTTNTVQQDDASENPPELKVDSPEKVASDGSPELLAAQRQAQEYMSSWQRERADFANFKKRAEREMKDLARNAAVDALMGLLPMIDDMERAMNNIPPELSEHVWVSGMGAIYRKFLKLLEDRGVSLIDPKGQPFDPARHEAVATEDSSEVESGHVTATLQKGYALDDRVLRPALVRVAN